MKSVKPTKAMKTPLSRRLPHLCGTTRQSAQGRFQKGGATPPAAAPERAAPVIGERQQRRQDASVEFCTAIYSSSGSRHKRGHSNHITLIY